MPSLTDQGTLYDKKAVNYSCALFITNLMPMEPKENKRTIMKTYLKEFFKSYK